MLSSDLSRFCVEHADGRFRVYRRTGERYADACVMEQDRWGSANIMVWGGIAYGERMQLVVLILQDNVLDVDLKRDVTSIKCLDLVWFHFRATSGVVLGGTWAPRPEIVPKDNRITNTIH